MKSFKRLILFSILFFTIFSFDAVAQVRITTELSDSKMIKEILENTDMNVTNNTPDNMMRMRGLYNPKANSANLQSKFVKLAENWKNKHLNLDLVKVKGAIRYEILGTKFYVLMGVLIYNAMDWDEILLLIDKSNGGLLDIANPQDVFTFKTENRNRYYQFDDRQQELYRYFQREWGIPDQVQLKKIYAVKTAKEIVRLVNANKKDSLYQLIAYNRKDNPKRKYLEETLSPSDAKDKAYVDKVFQLFQEKFSDPSCVGIEGETTFDEKLNTVSFNIKCNVTKKEIPVSFVIRNGYLWYFE
ncbi:MAG: hypothetical protein JST23_13055 [Bacteroidetes bacterium]|nr:hypothetical protein [Bacteroidota bacterium]